MRLKQSKFFRRAVVAFKELHNVRAQESGFAKTLKTLALASLAPKKNWPLKRPIFSISEK